MFCPDCGSRAHLGDRFCVGCGSSLSRQASDHAPAVSQLPTQARAEIITANTIANGVVSGFFRIVLGYFLGQALIWTLCVIVVIAAVIFLTLNGFTNPETAMENGIWTICGLVIFMIGFVKVRRSEWYARRQVRLAITVPATWDRLVNLSLALAAIIVGGLGAWLALSLKITSQERLGVSQPAWWEWVAGGITCISGGWALILIPRWLGCLVRAAGSSVFPLAGKTFAKLSRKFR